MRRAAVTTLALIASFSVTVCLAENEAFLKEVEWHMRQISDSEEGLADAGVRDGLQKAMRSGGDWDGALLHLIDPNKYDDQIIETAIGILVLRDSFRRPEVETAATSYFHVRVKAARAHDRTDELFMPVVVVGIRSLASRLARIGGPDLLLTVLEYAGSMEEQTDPLLDEYTVASIAKALLEKGDSRHLQGMRNLLAVTKDAAIKEKLERAIAKAASEVKAAKSHLAAVEEGAALHTPTTSQMKATPVAHIPAINEKHRTPAWRWAVGIVALVGIVAFASKRRA